MSDMYEFVARAMAQKSYGAGDGDNWKDWVEVAHTAIDAYNEFLYEVPAPPVAGKE